MGSKRKKKGAPAIVPRFLKGAVTLGAIPALVGACEKPMRRQQPVVAYFAPPSPEDSGHAVTPPPPPPPVVAAYKNDIQPVVAAYAMDAGPVQPVPVDASIDAPASPKKKKVTRADAAVPFPPPVVAAMVAPPPPVVAAYMPRDPDGIGSAQPKKQRSPKKP